MISMQREVRSDVAPDVAFSYLADFTTTQQWDPATVRTVRVSGDGGVGTRYANTSRFAGRVTTIDYVVTALQPGHRIELRAAKTSLIACDTITVTAQPPGCLITYRVDFAFQGALKWVEPALRPVVSRLLDDGARGLGEQLRLLPGQQL